MNLEKYIIAHVFAKFRIILETKYIFRLSRSQAIKWYITCPLPKSMVLIRTSKMGLNVPISRKSLVKHEIKMFKKIELNQNLWKIFYKVIYNMPKFRQWFSNERYWSSWTTSVSYSVKSVYIVRHHTKE